LGSSAARSPVRSRRALAMTYLTVTYLTVTYLTMAYLLYYA